MDTKDKICPVCGKSEFESKYDICPFCGWENDSYYDKGGANVLSLVEYKKRYERFVSDNPKYKYEIDGYPSNEV